MSREGDRPEIERGARVTPAATREGVRDGILAALEREAPSFGTDAAGRLIAAGVIAIVAAAALTMLFAGPHPSGESEWHLVLCSAAWAGLLVEAFAFVLLRARFSHLPIGSAAALALLGLAIAALMRLVCPDLQPLQWWSATALGERSALLIGESANALCVGICIAALLGFAARLVLAVRGHPPGGALVPALALSLLLLPAVALQLTGLPRKVGVAWAGGTLLGAYLGITAAQWTSSRVAVRRGRGL